MFKYIFIIVTILIVSNGCGYKSNPVYVPDSKEQQK